ncbi:MAG: TIM barrel protein, partial [Candidatus Thorarchaeota archaeon]
IELATFNEPVRKGGVESIVNSINVAEPLEPEAYVLHTTGALATEFSKLTFSPNIVNIICTLMSSFAATSVEEILAQTNIDSRKLAIENLEFPFDITRSVVDEYDTGICFDTGHLLAQMCGTESVIEFYHKHKDRIIELHLHDGSAMKTDVGSGFIDHRALGTQDLPVREFLKELMHDRFDGPIIFELTADEARQSLDHIKQVVPEAIDS